MTTLNLACRSGHTFEVWFRSAAEFSRQHAAQLVACPWCGDREIARRPSVPNIARSRDKNSFNIPRMPSSGSSENETSLVSAKGEKESACETDAEVALMPSSSMRSFARALRAFHDHIEQTCENVGNRFAEEARRMHEEGERAGKSCEGGSHESKDKLKDRLKNKTRQGIYGQATAEEVRSLSEDGIAISALPPLPNRSN